MSDRAEREKSRRQAIRRECQDLSVGKHGRDKSERIDLGLALFQRVALPGVQYTRDEIAAWAGCTDAAILLIERTALKKLRCRLQFERDPLLCELVAQVMERRAA